MRFRAAAWLAQFCFAPIACFVLVAPSHAQVLYGSITGNVTDATGAAVPAAKVEAVNTATGVAKQTTADDHGIYLVSDLQTGTYKVTISAASFATVVQTGVTLEANTVRRADARMQVAQVNQTVTVDASAPALQTDRADVNSQVSQAQLANLPLSGQRVFQSLYKFVPGSTPPAGSHSEAGNPQGALGVNVNGVSYNNNNTRIDGTTDLYPWLPEIVAYVPPADAIEQVSVETATFDAEQGMAGGSAVNVAIKSGTNQFHGSGWEYNTVSALKARNFFYYGTNNP
ncbi:MAG: carboxypeptidase-like regulatory domain-containing protein, partial [Bryobacteraceae bacterium]